MKNTKHQDHKMKRLYARDQSTGSKHWSSTNIFVCECGAILEQKFDEVQKNED